ncbi:MAG: 30S ribosomal protein S1, partial [Bacillus sp. (in: firmicutes)]
LEKEYEENTDYELPEESKGFQLGEVIGDKLKNLGK